MSKLLIFDAQINIDAFDENKFVKDEKVFLFPLTSRLSLLRKVKALAEMKGCQVEVISLKAPRTNIH